MRSEPKLDARGARFDAAAQPFGRQPGLARRIGTWLLHEALQALPPTLYFLVGFSVIVLTTSLLAAPYRVDVSNFTLATIGALAVGKAVLVANNLPFIRRYDRAPLILPILFKTGVYWVAAFLVRLLERFVTFAVVENNPLGDFPSYLLFTFSWRRFCATSLWVLVLFLIYETASEFSRLFGPGEIRRLLFTRRPAY